MPSKSRGRTADRLSAEPALSATPACTGLARLRSGGPTRRKNSVRMKDDTSCASARPGNLHDSPDGLIPADGVAIRPGERLGGPQSRPARTRPPDSQQVHAGDSGHSSRVGSRTHCLGLERFGQVAVPPKGGKWRLMPVHLELHGALGSAVAYRDHQPGQNHRGPSGDRMALGADGGHESRGTRRDWGGQADRHPYLAS